MQISFNTEFASKVFEVKQERDYMTLFIDNIRLYRREIANVKPEDKTVIDKLQSKNDLIRTVWTFFEYEIHYLH